MNRLSPKRIAAAPDGRHADGGGLYLRVRADGAYRHWIFRFSRNGKVAEMAIGAVADVRLAAARDEARRLREMVALGKDPISERRRAEAEQTNHKTFSEVAALVIKRGREAWAPSNLRGWNDSLLRDAKRLHDIDVADIGIEDVKRVAMPIFDRGHHVQAKRTLARISAVLNYAAVHGWRTAANIADWRTFKFIAPTREKADRRRRMIRWQETPTAVDTIRVSVGIGPRALEFIILTATRLREATDARWSEFDLAAKTWTIPAERMKARVKHTVPLSKRALAILDEMAKMRVGEFVFPARDMRTPICGRAVQKVCDAVTGNRASPHGFRSSFRSWCGAHGVDRELAEVALAHTLPGVDGVYHRDVMLERRRPAMEAWSDFVEGKTATAKVVPIRAKRR